MVLKDPVTNGSPKPGNGLVSRGEAIPRGDIATNLGLRTSKLGESTAQSR
jgi:hypothetical protein